MWLNCQSLISPSYKCSTVVHIAVYPCKEYSLLLTVGEYILYTDSKLHCTLIVYRKVLKITADPNTDGKVLGTKNILAFPLNL